jgi:hypothetical protein
MTSKISYQVFLQTQIPQFKHLLHCIEKGYYQAVCRLLNYYKMDTKQMHYKAPITACKAGFANILKQLLINMQAKCSIPAKILQIAQCVSCKHKNTECTILLVGLFNNSIEGIANLFVRTCYVGDEDLFKYLIKTYQVIPNALDNESIIHACEAGHVNIVKMLLEYQQVDPSVSNNLPLRLAVKGGHVDIVKLLLRDARVKNPDLQFSETITTKNANMIIPFLQDKRIWPDVAECICILSIACKQNHVSLLKVLLGRMKLSKCIQHPLNCIVHAIQMGFYEVCEMLLQYNLIIQHVAYQDALQDAYNCKHYDVVCLFATSSLNFDIEL